MTEMFTDIPKRGRESCVWNARLVEAFLIVAADTHRRLPGVVVLGHFNTWPVIARETRGISFDDGPTKSAPPTPRHVTSMEETMLWLRWLDRDDQKIVWDRANGRPWKAIGHDLGINRTTAWRRWTVAIAVITARLNAAADAASLQHRHMQHIEPNPV